MIIEKYFGGVMIRGVIDPHVSHNTPRPLVPEIAKTSTKKVGDRTMTTKSPSSSVTTVAVGKTKKKSKEAEKKKKIGTPPTQVGEGSVSLADALKILSCPLCSQWMMSPYRLMDMDTGVICCADCALLVYEKEISNKVERSSYLYYDANYFYPYRRINELTKKKSREEKANEQKA